MKNKQTPKQEFEAFVKERAGTAGVLLMEGAIGQLHSAVGEAGQIFLEKVDGMPAAAVAVAMQSVMVHAAVSSMVLDSPDDAILDARLATMIKYLHDSIAEWQRRDR